MMKNMGKQKHNPNFTYKNMGYELTSSTQQQDDRLKYSHENQSSLLTNSQVG